MAVPVIDPTNADEGALSSELMALGVEMEIARGAGDDDAEEDGVEELKVEGRGFGGSSSSDEDDDGEVDSDGSPTAGSGQGDDDEE